MCPLRIRSAFVITNDDMTYSNTLIIINSDAVECAGASCGLLGVIKFLREVQEMEKNFFTSSLFRIPFLIIIINFILALNCRQPVTKTGSVSSSSASSSAGPTVPLKIPDNTFIKTTRLYWSENGKIYSSDIDNYSNKRTVIDNPDYNPVYIAVDSINKKLYWADSKKLQICSSNLDGTNINAVTSQQFAGLKDVCLDEDGGKLYFTVNSSIMRINTSGSGIETFIDRPSADVISLAFDSGNGILYWLENNNVASFIYRIGMNGDEPEMFLSGIWPCFLASKIAGNKIYFVQNIGGLEITRADIDNKICENLYWSPSVFSLEVDPYNNKMYFNSSDFLNLCQSDINGTGILSISDDINSFSNDIALEYDDAIDDFNSIFVLNDEGELPDDGIVSAYGCVTDGSGNKGVVLQSMLAGADTNYLVLMEDAFGTPGSYGRNCQGYSYVQIDFNAPRSGTLKFDYYHKGYNPGPAPAYTLAFWENFTGDLATADNSTATWNNNAYTNGKFQTCSIPLTKGEHKLTWRVKKDSSGKYEDSIYLDNKFFDK